MYIVSQCYSLMFRVLFVFFILFFVCAQLCHCVRASPAVLLTLARFTVC
jgi:hypothetical protein